MYKPLYVLHVSGAPGTRASSRRARQSVGIITHVLGRGRRGGGGEWGPPGPPPSWASWPPAVGSQSTVSGTNGVFKRSRKSGGAGRDPHPGPMANAHSFPKVHRGHLAGQCHVFAVPLVPGSAGPKHSQRPVGWMGRYCPPQPPLGVARILRTSV